VSRHVEPLGGGVWSAPDPSLLKPGQLSAGRNFVYLGGSPAIYRSWGRDAFGVTTAVGQNTLNVNGLRDAQFDGGDHILIALASASLLTATVGDTGTFGVLASGLPGVGSQLEAVQYRNRFYLMPGISSTATIGTNYALYVSATGASIPASTRQHGMSPVISTPTVTTTAGTFSQTVTGKYWDYWTTEIAKYQADGGTDSLESTFAGKPHTQWVSAVGVVPIIQMPTIVNPITTHWRIYRSPFKEAAVDPGYPVGYMIAENPATGTGEVTSVGDTSVNSNTGWLYPANANGVGDSATFFSEWASAASAYTDNGVYASASSTFVAIVNPVQNGFYGFNFGGFGGTVNGLEIQVQAYISGGSASHPQVPLSIWIAPNRQTNGNVDVPKPALLELLTLGHIGRYAAKSSTMLTATAAGSPQTLVVGGATDRWFPAAYIRPLNSSDFNANLMVIVGITTPGVTVGVDYVAARAYYNGSLDSTVQFPTVVYTFGDEVLQVGKNGTPPSSSTGDMFQDSLVVNDLSDNSLIRYSYPGSPESFPSSYYLNFETRENDAVKMIRVVNNRLIVGLQTSLWRVNYLPSERDATFDRGKATECITRSYGVVDPMCCCAFTPDGASEQLAFVSNQGIHYTDGYNFTTLTDGVDWRTDVLSTNSGVTSTPIALINDKENCILRFYYRNDALTPETYMCLPLCYGAGHWANGQAKVGGLLHMRNYHAASTAYAPLKSAWQVERSNGGVDFLFGYGVQTNNGTTNATATGAGGGKVYRETGTTIPSLDSAMQYTTRRMYLAGTSREWKLGEVYGYAGSYTGSPVVTYVAKNTKTNGTGETTVGTKSTTLRGQQLHRVTFQQMNEGLRLNGSVGASSYRQEYLVLDGENFGKEDGGL